MKYLITGIGATALFLFLGGCSSTSVAQTPVTFPHVVGTLSPLQLVLVAEGREVKYRVVCADDGQYRAVMVEFHGANSDGGSGQVGPPDALAMCIAGTTVVENTPLPIMGAGDTLDVTFKIVAPDGRDQEMTRSLSKGADGVVRSSGW